MIKLPACDGSGCNKWNSLVKRMGRIENVTGLLRMMKNSNKGLLKNQCHFFTNMMRAHNKAKNATLIIMPLDKIGNMQKHSRPIPSIIQSNCVNKSHVLHSPVLLRHRSYFSDISKTNRDYNGFPSFIKEAIPIPDKNTLSVFDLSPITPAVISGAIK